MAEYIDRVEYCKNYCRCSKEFCEKETCPIWKAPAADVEPVVRCKDCKWDRPDILLDKHWCSCFFVEVRADDFCSHGARRAENAGD